MASPWFKFLVSGSKRPRYCQPDALILDPHQGKLYVVEYKLHHNPDAWWQLRSLYEPVLRTAFPPEFWMMTLVEVTKWFDPVTPFPEEITMCPDLSVAKPGHFSVHIWNGKNL